jgi:hypothetical protein
VATERRKGCGSLAPAQARAPLRRVMKRSNWFLGLAVATATMSLTLVPGAAAAVKSSANGATTAGKATTTTSTTRPLPPSQASITPNVGLANDQVVSVSWSGFRPTAPFTDTVGIFECKANPVHFFGDCYLSNPFLVGSGDANAVWSAFGHGWLGVTASNGTGSHNFKVLAGTLLGTPDVPSRFDCTPTSPCVIKVVDIPSGVAVDDATLANSPTIALNFAPLPNCPPTGGQQVSIEGAASSSYALQGWAAQLCQGANPVNVSYTNVPEVQGRQDFLSGSADMAVAAVAPTSSEKKSNPGARTYIPAPLDVGGVSVAFDIRDAATGLPAPTLHLTPRLVAMLLTNSATFMNLAPGSGTHLDAQGNSFTEVFTNDPEFKALNPGVIWPSEVVEPIIRAEHNDDALILTQWIAADFDAQQFLKGKDVCGAKVNGPWAAITYPTDIFVAADNLYPTYYFPLQGVPETVRHLLYQLPPGQIPGVPGIPPSPRPAVDTSREALTGIYDTVAANRSGFQAASLRAASPTSHLQPLNASCVPTSTSGFVAPTDAALKEGYQQMTVNADGTRSPPISTAVANAYPLAKVDYAFVPTSATPLSTANGIAALLRYAAGVGQTPGALPFGYPALPDDLAVQTAAAADAVVKNAVLPPAPTTTTTTASTTTTTRPTTSTAATSQPVTTLGTTGSSSSASTAVAHASSAPTAAAPPVAAPVNHQTTQAARKFSLAAGSLTGDRWLLPLFVLLSVLFGASGTILRWVARRTGRKTPRPS